MRFAGILSFLLACAIGHAATSSTAIVRQTPGAEGSADDTVVTRTLADLLKKDAVTSSGFSGFYEEIPPAIEPAVRMLGYEEYTSACEHLEKELSATNTPQERARILMWLGLVHGQEALDHPVGAWALGTSASKCLRDAISIDPKVYEASDVARTLSELVASGWSDTGETADAAMVAAEKKAETSRDPEDAFAAGVMVKRESARVWAFGDTSALDKRAFKLFARAVALNPEKYEFWSLYLPSLMPIGMHDLMTTESGKMFKHFRKLRTPLLGEQGPGQLHLRTRTGFTMADDDRMLNELAAEDPTAPWPQYQLALWAIETTPSLAVTRFEDFIRKVESGQIKLLPREAGYYPSAMYKLAFISQTEKSPETALDLYRKLLKVSPMYAEVNGNIAAICGLLSEKETTGPKKLALLEEGIAAARQQEKNNYRGKAMAKATEMRRRLQTMQRQVKEEMSTTGTVVAARETTITADTATSGSK